VIRGSDSIDDDVEETSGGGTPCEVHAGAFEWQEEPCGLKNGRVRAYTEIGDLDESEETNNEKRLRGEGLKAPEPIRRYR
jgi:hypothetical protein